MTRKCLVAADKQREQLQQQLQSTNSLQQRQETYTRLQRIKRFTRYLLLKTEFEP